jgi:N-acyl amino acid synthase of PEP-CTERM/exosortase system
MLPIKDLIAEYSGLAKRRNFTTAYNRTFQLLRANTMDLKERVYRLRHDVFCAEYGYLPASELPRQEKDAFDDHSVHFLLIHKATNESVGTLRVVLPDDERPGESFPAQLHCDHPLLALDSRALMLCEISQFCMASRFRQRPLDGKLLSAYHDQDTMEGYDTGNMTIIRRRIAYPQAALMQGAFEAALEAGLLDCVWLVEPRHLWSLNKIGFSYRVLGQHSEYCGGLQPVIFNIKNVLDTMKAKAPHVWDIVSDSGRLQTVADVLAVNHWHDTLIDEKCWNMIYQKFSSEKTAE